MREGWAPDRGPQLACDVGPRPEGVRQWPHSVAPSWLNNRSTVHFCIGATRRRHRMGAHHEDHHGAQSYCRAIAVLEGCFAGTVVKRCEASARPRRTLPKRRATMTWPIATGSPSAGVSIRPIPRSASRASLRHETHELRTGICVQNSSTRATISATRSARRHTIRRLNGVISSIRSRFGKSINPNRFFPLVPGSQWVYRSPSETVTVDVLGKVELIEGVPCTVVH